MFVRTNELSLKTEPPRTLMLLIPPIRKIGDITVYQDDTVWHRFYLLPSLPTVRTDAEGRPIFLLALYHISDQDRAEDSTLPRGGGYMNFDVQFAVSPADTESARSELQQWVDEEYRKRRADPQLAHLPEFASPTPPKVEFADPLLSGGRVTKHTTQSEHLVSARFAEAPASLVSGSTAVFNLDLTTTGASFMKDLMVGPDGAGARDLTPVQVIYDLKMWARAPAVKITVKGHSERIHKTLQKLSETNRDNPCTPREVETYRENGVNSSTLKESGHVEVHVDKGDASVPDEIVESLQEYALDLFDTMIEERFLVPAESQDDALEFDRDDPAMRDADPGWVAVRTGANYSGTSREISEDTDSIGDMNDKVRSVRVRSGHRVTLYQHVNYAGSAKQLSSSISDLGGWWGQHVSSVRVWRPPTTRYKVRETLNQSTMNLEITIDRSQVVEWPLVGQATLQTFFADSDAQAMRRHIVEVIPDDFNTLGVAVQVFVNFQDSPVQAVEVQTEYEAKDSTGERRVTPASFTFRAGALEPKKFDPAVVSGKREYRFRYRVIYDDGSQSPYTEWETTTNRALNVSVVDPGLLQLDVSGATLNWDLLRGVTVALSYADPNDPQANAQKTFELTAVAPSRKWQTRLGKGGGIVTAKPTYFLKDDKVVEGKVHTLDTTETLYVVPPPQLDVLNVSLVPAGAWDGVNQAVVSLEYDAGDGRMFDKTYRFTKVDEMAEWAVLLQDPTRRTFRYKVLVTYKNGDVDQGQWKTESGDQAIAVKVKSAPKLLVNVLANLVDFSRTPAVTASLSYGDERKTLSFTAPGTQTWQVPLIADLGREYAYEVTWHPLDGDPIKSGVKRTADTELFIRKAVISTPGKFDVIVRGFAVDFAATPFVDVTITLAEGGERKTLTLHQEQKNATWSVDIGDRTNRSYQYEVVYNLADGTRVDGPLGESDDPVISVTPHRP
ncbi:MAG: peptidase inhibitor family I36 protein [Nitrospirales bacterium]|nr:peptidase inhibitor family I36 protein [Nitrospirales bacterium]